MALPVLSAEALALHRTSIVVDLHADTLIPMRGWRYRIGVRHSFRLPFSALFWHCDLPRFAAGGVAGQFFGLVSFPLPERGCAAAAERQIALLRAAAARHPERLQMAWSAEDVRAAHAEGRLAALLGMEGAHMLEGDPGNVARFAALGVRYLGLAHFSSNRFAPAAFGMRASNDAPLPALGREAIAALGEHGMVLDLAHVGRRAFLDAVAVATGPVIVSHTGVEGAYRHWRNIDDERLRAIAATDGVVGIIFAGNFLAPFGRRRIDAVVAHLRHARSVIGARHLGIGSDFDGFIVPVRGLGDVSRLPWLTDALLRDGWAPDEVRGVLGENVLRVLAAHDARV